MNEPLTGLTGLYAELTTQIIAIDLILLTFETHYVSCLITNVQNL